MLHLKFRAPRLQNTPERILFWTTNWMSFLPGDQNLTKFPGIMQQMEMQANPQPVKEISGRFISDRMIPVRGHIKSLSKEERILQYWTETSRVILWARMAWRERWRLKKRIKPALISGQKAES